MAVESNIYWLNSETDIVQNILQKLSHVNTFVIIADSEIQRLDYLDKLRQSFEASLSPDKSVKCIVIPAGEAYKTTSIKTLVDAKLQLLQCTRSTCLVALGGGVIGDLVGFVAATYMRGIPVVQVPTTLLAMVDSSIGGKVAVDTPFGKNLIGAFHQPRLICINVNYLATLPERQFFNGLAEVVKTAAIASPEAFAMLEERALQIKAFPSNPANKDNRLAVLAALEMSSLFKAQVVQADEKESGLRAILNFGHTIGHAIEKLAFPNLLHGEAVSIGMALESEVALYLNMLSSSNWQRLMSLLELFELPTSLDVLAKHNMRLKADDLIAAMRLDKKNSKASEIRMVLLNTLGSVAQFAPDSYTSAVSEDLVRLVICPDVVVQPTIKHRSSTLISIRVPGSKSVSNRCLLMAALGAGQCDITGLLHSEDTRVMLHALKQLVHGFSCSYSADGSVFRVAGGGGQFRNPPAAPIYLGNAGTAARFLTSVMALVGRGGVLTGNERMKQRPIGPLLQVLRSNGAQIECLETEGCLPLRFSGGGASDLKGGDLFLDANISSQYVSSVLLAAPYFPSSVNLHLKVDELVSEKYIAMTVLLMQDFGGVCCETAQSGNQLVYKIPCKAYVNPRTFHVEGDASSATYPLAYGAITGTQLQVANVNPSVSIQGDAKFAQDILSRSGCEIVNTSEGVTLQGPEKLCSVGSVDMEPLTDAFLTACIVAARASDGGSTEIRGISNQRVKECNRILAMKTELEKFGVRCEELDDGIRVFASGESLSESTKGVFCYNDHRVAMSMSLLGLGKFPVLIKNKACVAKTWPSWFHCLRNQLFVDLVGSEASADDTISTPEAECSAIAKVTCKSIIIVGMRGVGKTFLGNALVDYWNNFSMWKPYAPLPLDTWRTIWQWQRIFNYSTKQLMQVFPDKTETANGLWQFLDMDNVFERAFGISVVSYSSSNSLKEFRNSEALLLERTIAENAANTIIATGGGCIEHEAAVRALQNARAKGHLVLFLQREGVSDLDSSIGRINLNESFDDTWKRRVPLYQAACNYILYEDLVTQSDVKALIGTVERHLQNSVDLETAQTCLKQQILQRTAFPSSFLCLTAPEYSLASYYGSAGCYKAVEVRVDMLASDSVPFVCQQISHVRVLYANLPIIFTVRTKDQGGYATRDRYFELLELGCELGCEVIDIEIDYESTGHNTKALQHIRKWKATYPSLMLVSFHDCSGVVPWCAESEAAKISGALVSNINFQDELQLKFMTEVCVYAAKMGADIIKLVSYAHNEYANVDLAMFRRWVDGSNLDIPVCALNMGPLGRETRVKNSVLTPVCAEDTTVLKAAAPGQLSLSEISMCGRFLGLAGFTSEPSFYLFGSPILKSLSPTVHNRLFAAAGLSHLRYELFETTDTADCIALIQKHALTSAKPFGASVTIPLKETLFVALSDPQNQFEVWSSPFVRILGAANTLYMPGDSKPVRKMYVDNTDWRAIHASLLEAERLLGTAKLVGIVFGAGGTAKAAVLALLLAGAKTVYVVNRTQSRVEHLASIFKDKLPSMAHKIVAISASSPFPAIDADTLVAVVGTVPGPAQTELAMKSWIATQLPEPSAETPLVLIEMAYTPSETELVLKYKVGAFTRLQSGIYNPNRFTVIYNGKSMLLNQALYQSRIWLQSAGPDVDFSDLIFD